MATTKSAEDRLSYLDFKDLLAKHQIDPGTVLVLRHTPKESRLKKVLPWLAADQPAIFNAYQQTQAEDVEKRMNKATYVASFIGDVAKSALFVGLYERHGQKPMTPDQVRAEPSFQELEKYGLRVGTRSPQLWFDLRIREEFFGEWKGKLAIDWPGGEINWHRFADKAAFKVTAIHAETRLTDKLPDCYRNWDLRWDELEVIPESWKATLRAWCGIYYIFDVSDGRGYVGKASGSQNLLGRWLNYADSGDGGNVKLRHPRDPVNFRFSILELIPGDMETETVEQREQNWMIRLRTRSRSGNRWRSFSFCAKPPVVD